MSPVVLLLVASLAAAHAFPQEYISHSSPGYSANIDKYSQASVDTEDHKFQASIKINSLDNQQGAAITGVYKVPNDDGTFRYIRYTADEFGFRPSPTQ